MKITQVLETLCPTLRPAGNASRRSAIGRFTLFTLLGVALLWTHAARADSLGSFSFTGTINNQNFYGAYPAFLVNDGVQVGDQIRVTFNLNYSAVGTLYGQDWTNAVQNIVVTDTTRGTTIAQVSQADLATQSFVGAYRWEVYVPNQSPFVMNFWLQGAASGVVSAQLPTTIDTSKFTSSDFSIFYNAGGNPTVLDAQISNTVSVTPEPSSLSLTATGLFATAYILRRKVVPRT